jgi:hypothetical protein
MYDFARVYIVFKFLFQFLLDIFFIYISNAILKLLYTPPPALLPYPPTPISWPWCSPVLGHIKFARPTRPSSATYSGRDTSSGVLVSSYCCSTYRVADLFSKYIKPLIHISVRYFIVIEDILEC